MKMAELLEHLLPIILGMAIICICGAKHAWSHMTGGATKMWTLGSTTSHCVTMDSAHISFVKMCISEVYLFKV